MDQTETLNILQRIKKGKLSPQAGLRLLKSLPFTKLPNATIDTHRALRCGFPEVIFCAGKNPKELIQIARALLKTNHRLLATRASPEAYRAIKSVAKDAVYHERARIVTVTRKQKTVDSSQKANKRGFILIITAGTSDIPVAEEARITAETMGHQVKSLYDIGIAGLHRLLAHVDLIQQARVIIVVAGMEGALPGLIGGLVDKPVIAVPTSTGYGASFQGLAALLTMLNSCAAGIGVVNIDNGFGAGYLASLINKI
jgi:pyridinium-3,5-biscarboxylic acid mononucleotide synthase